MYYCWQPQHMKKTLLNYLLFFYLVFMCLSKNNFCMHIINIFSAFQNEDDNLFCVILMRMANSAMFYAVHKYTVTYFYICSEWHQPWQL